MYSSQWKHDSNEMQLLTNGDDAACAENTVAQHQYLSQWPTTCRLTAATSHDDAASRAVVTVV